MRNIKTSLAYEIVRAQSSFGGEYILIGPDDEKKDVKKRPKPGNAVDGVGRPSPLEPEPHHVGIRLLGREEVIKLEKGKPPIQRQAGDVKTSFRPADSINPGNEGDSEDEENRESIAFWEVDKKLKCKCIAFPKITPRYFNSCHQRDLILDEAENKHSIKKLVKENRECKSVKLWRHPGSTFLHTLPIFTLKVQWKSGTNCKNYSLELIHALMSRHGEIIHLTQISPNSAVVEYKNVETARRAMFCKTFVLKGCPLICSWWFPEMDSYNTMIREQLNREEKKALVHLNESELLLLQLKSLQDRCQIQIKKYISFLHYDMAKFVP